MGRRTTNPDPGAPRPAADRLTREGPRGDALPGRRGQLPPGAQLEEQHPLEERSEAELRAHAQRLGIAEAARMDRDTLAAVIRERDASRRRTP